MYRRHPWTHMKSKPLENHSSQSCGFDHSYRLQWITEMLKPLWDFFGVCQTEKSLWQAPEKHNLDNNMPFEAPSSTSDHFGISRGHNSRHSIIISNCSLTISIPNIFQKDIEETEGCNPEINRDMLPLTAPFPRWMNLWKVNSQN